MNRKYKIGYMSGIFDMFNIRHLKMIINAKKQCDCLIVGVGTDDLVKQYGIKEPIIPFEERMAIVKAVKYVDKTIPIVSLNESDALEELNFNAFFTIGEWARCKTYQENVKMLSDAGVDIVHLV